jgi:hypothetical protein
MTPKEKAKDLLCNFYAIQSDEYNYGINWKMAKQCALIAVDEIINNFGSKVGDKTHYCNYMTIQYYEEVKQEIEKL